MNSLRLQRGVTFVVVMVMMVMMTLFVVAAINLSNVNLKIVFNFQSQRENQSTAQQVVDRVLSSVDNFKYTPAGADICPNGSVVPAGTCVGGVAPIGSVMCTFVIPREGYSKKLDEMVLEDTNWEVTSWSTSTNGSRVTLRQGVHVALLAGNCAP